MDALYHKTASPPGHEGDAVQLCSKCGFSFRNRRPSAKRRRAHKKVCGNAGGYPLIDAEGGRLSGVDRPEYVVKEELKRKVLVEHGTEAPMARAPICCFFGSDWSRKTSLFNCLSGGNFKKVRTRANFEVTGAIYVGEEMIRDKMKELIDDAKLNVPGLLLIDTPSHESFNTSRSRSVELCDIAILVVDIVHGMQPQEIELLKFLKTRGTKFLVAVTQIEIFPGWKKCHNEPIAKVVEQQSEDIQSSLNRRLTKIVSELEEQGMHARLYDGDNAMWEALNIVPTSAVSGEGVPDVLQLLIQLAQKTMAEKPYHLSKVQCTVLEVKAVEGHGTVIDVILVNGVLHEGDQIVFCSVQGPITTNIQALLMPHPMKEPAVKGTFKHHKEIKAPQCVKIAAQGLEPAVAGTRLYVVGLDDLKDLEVTVMEDVRPVKNKIAEERGGVYLQASTVGELEALAVSLKTHSMNFPVCGLGIGRVREEDIRKAASYHATILALDVRVMPKAQELADEVGVKIINGDMIDNVFYLLRKFVDSQNPKPEPEPEPKEDIENAVFPCVLMPTKISIEKDACLVVVDVVVLDGIAKIGTPLCIPPKKLYIGEIASIEVDSKPVDDADRGLKAVIKINCENPERFESESRAKYHYHLVSRLTQRSVKALYDHYKDVMSIELESVVVELEELLREWWEF